MRVYGGPQPAIILLGSAPTARPRALPSTGGPESWPGQRTVIPNSPQLLLRQPRWLSVRFAEDVRGRPLFVRFFRSSAEDRHPVAERYQAASVRALHPVFFTITFFRS